MNRRFIVRIEAAGRVRFQVVSGYREAVAWAESFATQNQVEHIAVLDATGRIIWQAR